MRHFKPNTHPMQTAKFTCDAEIGRPSHWHGCNRKAVIGIQTATCELHYCDAHKHHATDITGQYFKRASMAEPFALKAE